MYDQHYTERDVEEQLERGALPLSLPAVVQPKILLGAGFSVKYHVGHCFDGVSWARHIPSYASFV